MAGRVRLNSSAALVDSTEGSMVTWGQLSIDTAMPMIRRVRLYSRAGFGHSTRRKQGVDTRPVINNRPEGRMSTCSRLLFVEGSCADESALVLQGRLQRRKEARCKLPGL